MGNSGNAKTGKLIVTAAATAADPSWLTILGTGLGEYIHLSENLSAKKTPLDLLIKEINAEINVKITSPQFNKPDEARILLPQMLEASILNQNDFVKCDFDPDQIMDNLKKRLKDPEHIRQEMLDVFHKLYHPILTKYCDDDRLKTALNPTIIIEMARRQKEQGWNQEENGKKIDQLIKLAHNNPRLEAQKLEPLQQLIRQIAKNYLAETPDDPLTALQGIEYALQCFSEKTERLQSADNIDQQVKLKLDIAYEQASEGHLEQAVLTLRSGMLAIKKTLQKLKTSEQLYLESEIVFARALNNPQMAAKAEIQLLELEYPTEVYVSKVIEHAVEKMTRLKFFGTLFDGMVAEAMLALTLEWVLPKYIQNSTRWSLAGIKVSVGCYIGGSEGTRRLTEAVLTYRHALTIYTKEAHPIAWSMTQHNLGVALAQQGDCTGGKDGNKLLAAAATAYCGALTVYTKQDHPVDWARTVSSLGAVILKQSDRTGGAEGAKLLAESVSAYRDVLTVITKQDHPVDWATVQSKIGNILTKQAERTGGTEGTRLFSEAVLAYRDALSVHTKEDQPMNWAMALNNLGGTLKGQGLCTAGTESTRLFSEAVLVYRDALTVYTKQNRPVQWAMALNNLGVVLIEQGKCIGGSEGTRSITEAVLAYRDALTVHTKENDPVQWARIQTNIGNALLVQGKLKGGAEGIKLLDEAVSAFCDTLSIFTQQGHPVLRAKNHINLGGALIQKGIRTAGMEGSDLFTAAVSECRAALSFLTKQNHPVQWAKAQNSLCTALANLSERNGGEGGLHQLNVVIDIYSQLLTVYYELDLPVDWAMVQGNLGFALFGKAMHIGGAEGLNLLVEAVSAHRNTLTVYTKQSHPVDWAITHKSIAVTEVAIADHESTQYSRPHLETALSFIEAALTIYGPDHMAGYFDEAKYLHDGIRARLAN